jgi:hypothetical protein
MSFLGEIRRRTLFQAAAVDAVAAWLLIQIVAAVGQPEFFELRRRLGFSG